MVKKFKKLNNNGNLVALFFAVALFMILVPVSDAFAMSAGYSDLELGSSAGITEWPWTKFLNSLAQQLTGPLPMVLGVLGLAAGAIALFAGNGGAGTHKFIMLIFAVSTCLFAPTFIRFIRDSAGGLTVDTVVNTAGAVQAVVQSAGGMLP
jgi:type IV secretory pathway VirB2 component (pilin)